MNSLFKKISHIVPASITLIAFLLLRMCKLSPILGSHFSFFSLTDVLMPLTGAVGISLGLVAVMIRILFRASFVSLSVFELVRFAPGLCASYYWATNSKLVRLYLPLLCMALFIVHPVGYYAAPYALYWLIPVALYFQNKKKYLLRIFRKYFYCSCCRFSNMVVYISNVSRYVVSVNSCCCS